MRGKRKNQSDCSLLSRAPMSDTLVRCCWVWPLSAAWTPHQFGRAGSGLSGACATSNLAADVALGLHLVIANAVIVSGWSPLSVWLLLLPEERFYADGVKFVGCLTGRCQLIMTVGVLILCLDDEDSSDPCLGQGGARLLLSLVCGV